MTTPVVIPETGISSTGQIVVSLGDMENALASLQSNLLPLTGSTMTGPLYLASDPSVPTQASTKNYVDAQVTALETQLVTAHGVNYVANIAALRAASSITLSPLVCFVQGFATPGDGGQGWFGVATADSTTADNTGVVVVDQSARRWYRDVGGQKFSAKWFGAKGDGSTDDTMALQSCLNAASAGQPVYLPLGNYHYTTLYVPQAVGLEGDGVQSTYLTCTAAQGTINVAGPGVIQDIAFTSPAPRTSGTTLYLGGNDIQVRNIVASNYYVFALVGSFNPVVEAVAVRFSDSDFFAPATGSGSGAINFLNYSNGIVEGCVMTGPASGQQADYGVQLVNGDTFLMTNTNISAHGFALLFSAGSGQNIFSAFVVNCVFDSAGQVSTGAAASMAVLPSGNVQDAQFTNCWFGLTKGNSGAVLTPAGPGTIKDVDFTGCKFIANAIDGVTISGTGTTSICISGGDAKANASTGIDIVNGATDITVTGVRASANSRGNQNIGINLSGAAANCLITGNNLHGNAETGLQNTATGTNNLVINNITA